MPTKKIKFKNLYHHPRKLGSRFKDIADVLLIKFLKTSVSFAKACPEAAIEWFYEKNCGYGPEDFPSMSHVAAWFKCHECKYVWQTLIKVRTGGHDCPNCNCGETTDLRDFPDVLSQFDRSKNKNIDPHKLPKQKKVWWRCKKAKDHIWYSSFPRKMTNRRCPFCRGVRASSTNNLTKEPDIAKQFHPTKNGKLKAKDIPLGSKRLIWWKCKKGSDHIWKTTVEDRVKRGSRCPFCTNRRVGATNSLAVLYPKIAKEWHKKKNKGLTPNDVIASSHKECWWQCLKCNYSWLARVEVRTIRGFGCPACTGRVITKEKSLAGLFPEIATEWHPFKNGLIQAKDVHAGTNKKYWFRCKRCSHSWQTVVNLRTRLGYGCPKCRKSIKFSN